MCFIVHMSSINLFGQHYCLNFGIFVVTHSFALTLRCIIPHKLFVSLTVRPGGTNVLRPDTFLVFLLLLFHIYLYRYWTRYQAGNDLAFLRKISWQSCPSPYLLFMPHLMSVCTFQGWPKFCKHYSNETMRHSVLIFIHVVSNML